MAFIFTVKILPFSRQGKLLSRHFTSQALGSKGTSRLERYVHPREKPPASFIQTAAP